MAESLEGEWYVYEDEDHNAIALAFWVRGPNGGMMGRDIARMSLPRPGLSQAQINEYADQIVRAMNAARHKAA